MKRMRRIAGLLMLLPVASYADDWVVRKNQSNMNCYVQPATGLGNPAPDVLATKPSKKEACQAAKDLASDDPSDARKCQAYTPNSTAECKAEGVILK